MGSTKRNNTSIRLPLHIKPEHYWLSLVPNFANFTFTGQETITLELKKPDSKILLHSKDLIIKEVFITDGEKDWPAKVSFDKDDDLVILNFTQLLPKGAYNLYLTFAGVLDNKMRGFYRSEYLNNGKTEHIAVTQFEPTDARKAFPCFDEPAMKASFSLETIVPSGMEAISNTTITSKIRQKNGLIKVKFSSTPVMSTYLLALVVGKFEFIEDLSDDGITVRVWTTPGKKFQAKFALETAKGVLTYFNRYFKIKYPLPTLDLVAIPDFAAGAMENWGAVTFRETAILVDPKNTSTLTKQWVGLVIAHELAHQWFGNLVTMKWWTHLWLNEGFASFISYYAVDHLYPEWNMWSQFANSELGPALQLDSLKNTHPIQVEVYNTNEINEIFDEVSYAKGATVLRMLADYLGEIKFRDGLRHYLKKYQYNNASTENLWQSLETVSRKPVRKIMNNWITCEGYPLLSVTEQKNKLVISQKRYLADKKQRADNKVMWSVPISISTEKTKLKIVLNNKKALISKPKGTYTKFNFGEVGMYRTKYGPGLLKNLVPAIAKQAIPPADRLGILRDYIALARAGEISTDRVLDLVLGYKNEQKYTVWMEIGATLGQINHIYKNERFGEKLRAFTKEIFTPITNQLGWEALPDEPTSTGLLRSFALYRAGHYGNEEVIQKAQKLFLNFLNKKIAIPADLRSVVYNLVAENGSIEEYNNLHKLYRKQTLQEEKNRIARAMALFPNEKLLKKFLNFAISKEVRMQDAPLLIAMAWNNKMSGEIVWKFLVKNWKELLKRYGDGGHLLVRLVDPMGNFVSEKQARMVSKFFKTAKAPGAERTIQQAIEEIRIQASWHSRDLAKVSKYINSIKT